VEDDPVVGVVLADSRGGAPAATAAAVSVEASPLVAATSWFSLPLSGDDVILDDERDVLLPDDASDAGGEAVAAEPLNPGSALPAVCPTIVAINEDVEPPFRFARTIRRRRSSDNRAFSSRLCLRARQASATRPLMPYSAWPTAGRGLTTCAAEISVPSAGLKWDPMMSFGANRGARGPTAGESLTIGSEARSAPSAGVLCKLAMPSGIDNGIRVPLTDSGRALRGACCPEEVVRGQRLHSQELRGPIRIVIHPKSSSESG
jgi:hypothetical protein